METQRRGTTCGLYTAFGATRRQQVMPRLRYVGRHRYRGGQPRSMGEPYKASDGIVCVGTHVGTPFCRNPRMPAIHRRLRPGP